MDLTANSISIIEKTKSEFEENMKAKLVNDTFRNVVTKAIPLRTGELDKINNPEFKEKFSGVLSEVSKGMVDQFSNVAQFDTGNMFTSMVTSISDSVALEADYRMNKLYQKLRLGKVNQNDPAALHQAAYEAFANMKTFESKEVWDQFTKDAKFIMATEEANDIIDRIKNDVKDAIDETEAKNDLVEGTTKEIIDYKNEVAPPDDEYQDPENPEDTEAGAEGEGDDMGDPEAGDDLADTSDDGMGAEGEGEEGSDDQVYEDDGTGTEETDNGEGEDPEADPDMEGGEDDMSDMGDGTEAEGEGDDMGDPEAEGEEDGMDDPEAEGDVGGEDGIVDEGDVGKPVENVGGSDAPEVSDGNSNQNSGGITININGADLAKAKESCNLYSPRSLAEKRVPLHPKTFNNMKLPSIGILSAECVNAGEGVEKEMKYRLDGLRYATKQANLSQEAMDNINNKLNNYGKIIGESINNAKNYQRTLESIGITPNGLIFSNENTLCVARNIINRFLMKKQFVSPTVRPYTSKENVFANAFDIVQLRKYVNSHESVSDIVVNDLFSRENLFYHNMINYNDAEVKKQASAIIDLSLMNFNKAMSPNFITDYKIKSWELNVGDKANKDINEVVVGRVKDKFEKLWMRELNDEEMKIIRGAANQEDVTELTPTPYEKFMITMTKESIMAHGCEDPSVGARLSKDEKRDIEWKARLMTTVYKAAECLGAFDKYDTTAVDRFMNMVGM